MNVAVTLDMLAATPPYEQVRAQLAGHIRAGALRPGEKLPVVRALAADLGVATNTIARAFQAQVGGALAGAALHRAPQPPGVRVHALDDVDQHRVGRLPRHTRDVDVGRDRDRLRRLVHVTVERVGPDPTRGRPAHHAAGVVRRPPRVSPRVRPRELDLRAKPSLDDLTERGPAVAFLGGGRRQNDQPASAHHDRVRGGVEPLDAADVTARPLADVVGLVPGHVDGAVVGDPRHAEAGVAAVRLLRHGEAVLSVAALQ